MQNGLLVYQFTFPWLSVFGGLLCPFIFKYMCIQVSKEKLDGEILQSNKLFSCLMKIVFILSFTYVVLYSLISLASIKAIENGGGNEVAGVVFNFEGKEERERFMIGEVFFEYSSAVLIKTFSSSEDFKVENEQCLTVRYLGRLILQIFLHESNQCLSDLEKAKRLPKSSLEG